MSNEGMIGSMADFAAQMAAIVRDLGTLAKENCYGLILVNGRTVNVGRRKAREMMEFAGCAPRLVVRYPYTMAEVALKFRYLDGLLERHPENRVPYYHFDGNGFARYNPCDVGVHPWDEDKGKRIALGRAYRDLWARVDNECLVAIWKDMREADDETAD